MRRVTLTLSSALALTMAAAPAFAQSRSVHCDNGAKSVRGAEFDSSTSATVTMTGVLLESDAAEGYFVVSHERLDRSFGFRSTEDVKLKADKRTRLRGLKDLTLGDYQVGDRVEVRYRPGDGRVYELKLKRASR